MIRELLLDADQLFILMNRNRDMEVHFGNSGVPYITPESFAAFYGGIGIDHGNTSYTQAYPMNQQGNFYCPVNTNANAYKFEYPGVGNTYFDHFQANNHLPYMDSDRRVWEFPSIVENEELTTLDVPTGQDTTSQMHVTPEECSPVHDSSQVIWQDNVDPDNMTYEEFDHHTLASFSPDMRTIEHVLCSGNLGVLGEAVGIESRGLSQELINTLPTSRYKPGGIFSRKRSKERCVIRQMRFRIGEKRTKLPCKHRYHWECISKWLSINKKFLVKNRTLTPY